MGRNRVVSVPKVIPEVALPVVPVSSRPCKMVVSKATMRLSSVLRVSASDRNRLVSPAPLVSPPKVMVAAAMVKLPPIMKVSSVRNVFELGRYRFVSPPKRIPEVVSPSTEAKSKATRPVTLCAVAPKGRIDTVPERTLLNTARS